MSYCEIRVFDLFLKHVSTVCPVERKKNVNMLVNVSVLISSRRAWDGFED